MKLAIYTNSISPHQLPLMRELAASFGAGNVLYAYESTESKGRRSLGWNQVPEQWCRQASECSPVLETCDTLLVGGLRPVDLMEKRAAGGLRTLYMSERWFKPPIGIFRLLHPKYFLMAWRIVRLIRGSQSVAYLSIGIHSACDMVRLCGLFAGDLRCLFRAPRLEFERKPGGRVFLARIPRAKRVAGGDALAGVRRSGAEIATREGKKYCLDKIRMWGYFVRSSEFGVKSSEVQEGSLDQTHNSQLINHNSFKVLWVGRFLKWKCVDTVIRAVGKLSTRSKCRLPAGSSDVAAAEAEASTRLNITLDIYGTGPEEAHLKHLAAKYGDAIRFYPPVPIDKVRNLMRTHDAYVLSSNAYEGWGAVVSEALEEGMKVIGTYEAGASATMLPKERLFHAGEWRALAGLLEKECLNELPPCAIGDWSAAEASRFLAR